MRGMNGNIEKLAPISALMSQILSKSGPSYSAIAPDMVFFVWGRGRLRMDALWLR
jgi:hypothetical protein